MNSTSTPRLTGGHSAALALSIACWLGMASPTAGQPAPPPYDLGGGRPIKLDDGRLLDRDTVYRFLPATLPLATADVSSPFGLRHDPFGSGAVEMHGGADFRAPIGTPVHATAAGTVTAAGTSGAYGVMVEITHPFGFKTRYAHLASITVQVGEVVDRNTVVGTVGNSGRSSGPHLLWETWKNGIRIDPIAFAIRAYAEYVALGTNSTTNSPR